MKAKLFWFILLIMATNLISYMLTVQNARHKNANNHTKNYKKAKNLVSCLNLNFTPSYCIVEPKINDVLANPLILLHNSKEEMYQYFKEIGYTRKSYDNFTEEVDDYISEGNLSYYDMYMLFNYEGFVDYFQNKGYREGINSLNPDSLRDKIVSRIVLDSFDNKNTCQYFNTHKSYLFKTYDEALALGLFKNYYSQTVFWSALDWVIYKLEDYYFNPSLRNKKEKILSPNDNEKNITMEETKKGN